MKILCIGDPHFKIDNAVETTMFTERCVELIKKTTPDLCVMMGDLLHTHENVHVSPYNKVCEFISLVSKEVETYILVGNHDMINNTQFLTENHWMNPLKKWKNITIVDTVHKLTVKNLTFYFCPYVSNGRFIEALNTKDEEWKTATCIFAHQEFRGCKMGAIMSKDGDEWDLSYPLVVSGHIHNKQRPQENIYYTGSAMQNAFGESESNTLSILTYSVSGVNNDGHCLDIREEDLNLPRKRIIYQDINNIEEYNLPEEGQDKIKLTVKGDAEQLKQFKKSKKYKELSKKGTKIVFKPTVSSTSDHVIKVDSGDFTKILRKLIKRDEKSEELMEIYNKYFG